MPPKSSDEKIRAIKLRLDADEEKIIEHDKSLKAIRNLLKTGIRMLVNMEEHQHALVDSQTRLYGTMQELSQSHKELAQSQKELAEAQKRTELALQRFLKGSGPRSN